MGLILSVERSQNIKCQSFQHQDYWRLTDRPTYRPTDRLTNWRTFPFIYYMKTFNDRTTKQSHLDSNSILYLLVQFNRYSWWTIEGSVRLIKKQNRFEAKSVAIEKIVSSLRTQVFSSSLFISEQWVWESGQRGIKRFEYLSRYVENNSVSTFDPIFRTVRFTTSAHTWFISHCLYQ